MGYKKTLVIADCHIPYHDKNLIEKIIELIKKEAFDSIHILGDFLDCVSISKFPKEPDRYDYLNEELDDGMIILAKMRLAIKEGQINYIPGNHELRLQKFLCSRARPLAKLKSLMLSELLCAKEIGINFITESKHLLNKNFLLIHGTRCGENPSRGELLAHGMSGMSGHAHKQNKSRKNFFNRPGIWYSIGHLADVTQLSYSVDFSFTWNQGFAVIEYNDAEFNVIEVEPINGNFIYNGVKY